jgi:transposase
LAALRWWTGSWCRGGRVARAAEAMNISRATAYKWVRRFQQEGPHGLQD